MSTFQYDHPYMYTLEKRHPFVDYKPVVTVEMTGFSKGVRTKPVSGLVDTGATRTFLNLATAKALGIQWRDENNTAVAVNKTPISYFLEWLEVQVPNHQNQICRFYINAAISSNIVSNYFGRDWLEFMCIAFDNKAVHFLPDRKT